MAVNRILAWAMLGCLACCGCQPGKKSSVVSLPTSQMDPGSQAATGSETRKDSPNISGAENTSRVPADESTATDKSNSATESANSPTMAAELKQSEIPPGDWTVTRLILLTQGGPTLIDLALRVGDAELAQANSQLIQPIQAKLIEKLGEPATWEKLLELPLIQSGWIGNLVAPDQSQQIIGMYDANKDGQVQVEELELFLTRGLSRSMPFVLQDAGVQPGRDNNSLGILDTNNDNVLSIDEMQQAKALLGKYDYDGDSSITLGELVGQASAMTGPMSANPARSMLSTKSLVFETIQNDDAQTAAAEDRKEQQRKINQLLEHYSFLGTISREQWTNWPDEQWGLVDKNRDGSVDKRELLEVFRLTAPVTIALQLPDPRHPESSVRWYFKSSLATNLWHAQRSSGQFSSAMTNLQINLDDGINFSQRNLLRTRLNQALKEAPLKQVLLQQLDLKENALSVADEDGDQSISEAEALEVWTWIIARGAARLQGRWQVSANPWFQLIDQNHNQIVSEVELSQLSGQFSRYDKSQDQEIDQSEIPVVVQLQLTRRDQRLILGPETLSVQDAPTADGTWFEAMDTNRDGSISKFEFLGPAAQFKQLDENQDSFLSAEEAAK
jgi:EF hand